jgi:hypothetical protein
MKRTNAPPIPEGLRIELNGEQEWKDVMQVFEKQGWRWLSGVKPHEKQTCAFKVIQTTNDKRISIHASVPITTNLTAAQFLQQYQGTIEYEVGDWVVILEDQSGDPEGTITQIVKINHNEVDVKNIIRKNPFCKTWSASIDSIRPATPEEIASVTKVEPVAVKKPEPYIWDGDVLPDEYWVENPWPCTNHTEFLQLFKRIDIKCNLSGDAVWYFVKNNRYYDSQEQEPNTELPIVPYELWKQILTTPDNQVEQPAVEKWSIVTTDGVEVYEGEDVWWLYPDGKKWFGDDSEEGDKLVEETDKDHIKDGYLPFSTFEAAEEYISKQKQPAGRKWKIGDRYCNPADMADSVDIPNTEGWYIRQVSRDNYKMETVDGEDKMSRYSYTAKQIDNYIKRGDWIPYSENKEKEDNTIISKQTKTKQNEKGNSISITEQCIVISSNYINYKTSNATYVPGDEERITKGQRRQGFTVRG